MGIKCDVEKDTFNIDPLSVEKLITKKTCVVFTTEEFHVT